MKILFIGTSKYDYLQDLTYSGLVKVLGKKNIIEYKYNPKYHLPTKKYPKNLGYNGLSILPHSNYKNIDYVFVASAKPKCFEMYKEVLPQLSKTVKTVFIDGSDLAEIGGDLTRLNNSEIYNEVINQRPFDIIFKREYLKTETYDSNIFPLPFSVNMNKYKHIKSQQYKYDVSFWAIESHPIRTQVLELLQNKFDCKENGTITNQTFSTYKRKGDFYFEELKACKVNLNFRGNGWDTLRYWEVVGLKSFMISQKLDIVIPNDFEHEKEIIHCAQDLSDLEDLCKYYLKHEDKRIQLADNAYKKALDYHTDEQRARYILDILKNN